MSAFEMWFELDEQEHLAAGDRGLTLDEASARCREARQIRVIEPGFSIETARRAIACWPDRRDGEAAQ